jgi:hypothetical protein
MLLIFLQVRLIGCSHYFGDVHSTISSSSDSSGGGNSKPLLGHVATRMILLKEKFEKCDGSIQWLQPGVIVGEPLREMIESLDYEKTFHCICDRGYWSVAQAF